MRTSRPTDSDGFTVAEVLITLFIVGLLVASGYQAYALVASDSQGTRQHAEASNIAYEAMRRLADSSNVTSPCGRAKNSPDEVAQTFPTSTLPQPRSMKAVFSCPFGSSSTITLVTIIIEYGSPAEKVTHAIYTQ